jgi:hypothetical protein
LTKTFNQKLSLTILKCAKSFVAGCPKPTELLAGLKGLHNSALAGTAAACSSSELLHDIGRLREGMRCGRAKGNREKRMKFGPPALKSQLELCPL